MQARALTYLISLHVQALVVFLSLLGNYSRCHLCPTSRGCSTLFPQKNVLTTNKYYSEITEDNIFWSILSTLLPVLFCGVKFQLPSRIKASYWAVGEIPRDINCCLKSLQRTFLSHPPCINSQNEEIGLDFILPSAPQVFVHFKNPSPTKPVSIKRLLLDKMLTPVPSHFHTYLSPCVPTGSQRCQK